MKLLALAAFVAVCEAAKLDRTYLPPASAKTAGGSPGSLQTPLTKAAGSIGSQSPFAGNSLNNGVGGLPKGSYTNEFQGVVVDAALAGTRATGETGLGGPRISYGSTDSKVGSAAFRVQQQPSPNQHQAPQTGNNQPQRYRPVINQQYGSQPAFNQPQSVQPNAYQPQAAQPNFNQPQGVPNFYQSQAAPGFDQPASANQPERPQTAFDRTANTVKLVNEVGPENYNFAFETDNGIAAEEHGVATDEGIMAHGGYSYTADDGQTYSVSYVADENGYQPKGDHLPTPPPIPEEILKSLEQNARDEAAGVVDDGMYDAKKYNTGGDYASDNNDDGKYTHQSAFGDGIETDKSASGSFNDQNRRPNGKPYQSGLSSTQNGGNNFGQNAKPGKFEHQGSRPSAFGASNQFSGTDSQNAGQYNQNSALAYSSSQHGASSFGQNAKPGKFDHQGSRPNVFRPSNQFSGSVSLNSGQYTQNSAPGSSNTPNGANSFGQNAKPGKFDHQSSRPSALGSSNHFSGSDSQNAGQFDQNGTPSPQEGASSFGHNAKPGKFDQNVFSPSNQFSGSDSQNNQNGAPDISSKPSDVNSFGQKPGQSPRPSAFGTSNQISGQNSQDQEQFSNNGAVGFPSVANTFGQNAKPGKFDHQGARPSGFGQLNEFYASHTLNQNGSPGLSNSQNGINSFGQNVKPGNVNYQGSRPSGFGASNQLSGPDSQNPERFSQIEASGELAIQANNAGNYPSVTSSQNGDEAKPNNGFGFPSETNAFAEASFQGFGNKNQYLPPGDNVNSPQGTYTIPQGKPQTKPQSKPQDSGSSESSSSEENSSEEDSSLSNQPLKSPQKPSSPHGFPSRVSNQPTNDYSGPSSFGTRPTQAMPFGNEMTPSNSNHFAGAGLQQQNFGFGNKKEYLPPSQNGIPSSPNQQYYGNNQAPGFQSPFPQPHHHQGRQQNSFPSPTPSQIVSESQPAFEPQQYDSFQNPQTGNPSLHNGNGQFPSQPSGAFAQNGAFDIANGAQFGQQSQSSPSTSFTPQPDNGLTTPLNSAKSFAEIGHHSPTVASPVSAFQSQFGNQFNSGQYTSPAASFSSTPAFGAQPTPESPAPTPESIPFGNQYQEPQYGNFATQSQNTLSQNAQDSQFAPSTQRPNYAQQSGAAESYIYNQPPQPVDNQGSNFPNQVSSFPDQGSSFPSTSSNQFGSASQSPSYPTDQYSNTPENSPSNPPVQYSPQGPINYPNPPTLPSASPTTSTEYQGNTVSGITQAAISSFPSVSSTQESFNTQNTFQSRPGFQQSTNQFNQGFPGSKASFGSAPSSSAPQTAPQLPTGAQQTFDQDSTHPVENSSDKPVPTQQYQGELYDYSKPAELPPAPENEGKPGAGQFGVTNPAQETSQPDSEGSQSTVAPQFGSQEPERQQFGAKPSRPFSQSTLSPEVTMKYGEEESADESFPQQANPSRPQNNNYSPSSPLQSSQSRPQFGSQSNSFDSQTPESQENIHPAQSTPAPFGLRPCLACQKKKSGSQDKPQQGFGFKNTPSTSRPTMNSFAGKGETFDATRKPPPSFDENGYHY